LKIKNTVLALGILTAAATSGMAVAQDGKSLYSEKGCASCHGADAKSPANASYPKLAGQNMEYLARQIKDIKSGARNNGLTVMMKPVVADLDEADIEAIATYLSTL